MRFMRLREVKSDGFLSYIDHGISFFASVFGGGDEELPYFMLNESLKGQEADWESGGQYSDVRLGEVIKTVRTDM